MGLHPSSTCIARRLGCFQRRRRKKFDFMIVGERRKDRIDVSKESKSGIPLPEEAASTPEWPGKITVILSDDHNIVREGLRLLLESADDIKVIGEAENGRQALQLAKDLKPDVAVLDIAMPVLNGLEATRQIVKEA